MLRQVPCIVSPFNQLQSHTPEITAINILSVFAQVFYLLHSFIYIHGLFVFSSNGIPMLLLLNIIIRHLGHLFMSPKLALFYSF